MRALRGNLTQILSRIKIIDTCYYIVFTDQLWQLFLNFVGGGGVPMVRPGATVDLLRCCNRAGLDKGRANSWNTNPACIWLIVWTKRNSRCFEDKFHSIQKMKPSSIFVLLWHKRELNDVESILDFIESLNQYGLNTPPHAQDWTSGVWIT